MRKKNQTYWISRFGYLMAAVALVAILCGATWHWITGLMMLTLGVMADYEWEQEEKEGLL